MSFFFLNTRFEIIIRDKVETESVHIIVRYCENFEIKLFGSTTQRKYLYMIFSDRTQSDVIGGKWYLLSSRETRLTKQI